MTQPILIVQGGLWGSEAKGAVSLALCQRQGIRYAVRTGSVNAGHTIVTNGDLRVFQQLPVACVLPAVTPVLGPGAYVNPAILEREVQDSECLDRLVVDTNCGVHLDSYTGEAARAARNVKIGATGKGCAEAVIHKLADRGVGTPLLFREWLNIDGPLAAVRLRDTAEMLVDAYHAGESIMLEGTQGSLLDLHCGPYPFVTSRQTTAAAWVAEAGLSPALDYEVCLVVRTRPIRVAGPSGPMPGETTWPALARRMNARLRDHGLPPVVEPGALDEFEAALDGVVSAWRRRGVPEAEISLKAATEALAALPDAARSQCLGLFETTTVTRRLRRVADLDVDGLALTVKKEDPEYLALTFLNYQYPELCPQYGGGGPLHAEALDYLADLQDRVRCWIRYVSVGPRSEDLLETPGSLYRPYRALGRARV